MKMLDKIIIDVRTKEEFMHGHVDGSVNIPLQEIAARESEITSINKPIVFCCASGNRSGHATAYFQSKGITCENGGSWLEVQSNFQL